MIIERIITSRVIMINCHALVYFSFLSFVSRDITKALREIIEQAIFDMFRI